MAFAAHREFLIRITVGKSLDHWRVVWWNAESFPLKRSTRNIGNTVNRRAPTANDRILKTKLNERVLFGQQTRLDSLWCRHRDYGECTFGRPAAAGSYFIRRFQRSGCRPRRRTKVMVACGKRANRLGGKSLTLQV